MNKFFSFVLVLAFVLGFSTFASAQVVSPKECNKLGTSDLRAECNAQYLGWLHGQLEAAEKVCDLAIEPEKCTEKKLKTITNILVNVRELGMIHFNLDNDHNFSDCRLTDDAPMSQYLQRHCEVRRDYHKLEDLVASESRIRRQKEANASPAPKVKTIEEARPAPRKPSTGIPKSFIDNDKSSKRPLQDADNEPARQDCRYKGHPIRDGQAIKDEIGCNDCTCDDGVVMCTMMDCYGGEDEAFQPSPRRQVRRPAVQQAPISVLEDPRPIPMAQRVTASTYPSSFGEGGFKFTRTERLFPEVPNHAQMMENSDMVCVGAASQPKVTALFPDSSGSRYMRIYARIEGRLGLWDCLPAGVDVYVSGIDTMEHVYLYFVRLTRQTAQVQVGNSMYLMHVYDQIIAMQYIGYNKGSVRTVRAIGGFKKN